MNFAIDVKEILAKETLHRNQNNIKDLAFYFREYEFFKKYSADNGVDSLNLIYKAMNYEFKNKDEIVIQFGDFGTTFYILLRGTVSVRIPAMVSKEFDLRNLLKYTVENDRWIIRNFKYDEMLNIIHEFFPELVKINYAGEMSLNHSLSEKVLSGYVLNFAKI